jgi:cbb3-type cytochrome c oxidase subunit II
MSEPTPSVPAPDAAPPPTPDNHFSIHTSHHAILLLPFCIYVVLVVIVAVLPALEWNRDYPPSGRPPPTELVRQGEREFISQGCTVCHTQQIRGDERSRLQQGDRLVIPVLPPDARFGLDEPSLPEHYADSSPPLLGTQRTGPDLTGVGDRLPSASWHYWHLYDPRSVSPDSVMPSYRYLFRITDNPDAVCPEPEPPSWALLLGIILGLALLFGLLGWMLFGFSSSMVLALLLGIGAGLLVADECRECDAPAEQCEVVKDTIDTLGLGPDQRLVATPKARALAEYLMSLRRPARNP